MAYTRSAGLPLPGAGFALALFELGCRSLLLVGSQTLTVATVLAFFVSLTGLLFHYDFADQNQFIHFIKNGAITGGLLNVAVFGGGALSIDGRRQ